MLVKSQPVEQKDNFPKPKLPPDPFFSPDQNRLKFNCSYFAELGKSYIYTVHNSDKCILIDKKNSLYSDKLIKELTNKGNHYVFSFFPEQFEKYRDQDHVYYFSEKNDNFAVMIRVLNPTNLGNKSEKEFTYLGQGENNYYVFDNIIFMETSTEDFAILFISENHPQIKKLLSKGKLQSQKHFIIRYGVPNWINKEGKYGFEESNQDLEITEA